MTIPTKAVGYIRVSTDRQNEGDHALERQAEKIRKFCAERAMNLISIFEDTGSAVDDFSVARRPGLDEAIKRAVREDACLIIPDPTRLFRNLKVAEQWLKAAPVQICSVKDGIVLTHEEVLEAVRIGQKVARSTREGTVEALANKRASGVKLGSKADRTVASKASAIARKQRSDSIVDMIARVLREDQAYRDLSHRALADLLNRRKILTGWERPWTAVGIKRHRKLAEERILEWVELEREALVGEELSFHVPASKPEPALAAASKDDDEKQMNALPTFGMF